MSNVTITRPKCSIRGCPRPMLTRKLGLCNMHRARFLRTGKVGPAGSAYRKPSKAERPARKNKVAASLEDIVRHHGMPVRIWCSRPGKYEVRDYANAKVAREYPIVVIQSLERRGWLKLRNKDQMVKEARVTATGAAAIQELGATKKKSA